jgi:molybdopterin-guanine dinucleotide biosynthesis protein A
MGRDKARLPFGPGELMLQRVARIVAEAVPAERTVCVAAPDQEPPRLPAAVRIAFDPMPHQGPLAGLAVGLAALNESADVVFVIGCDAPLLKPAFIERMFAMLADYEIAAVYDGHRWQPLAAVYRASILPRVEALAASGKSSLVALLESSPTRRVTAADLRDADPELVSLRTCNTSEQYRAALRESGFSTSE